MAEEEEGKRVIRFTEDLLKLLSKYQEVELEDVYIEAEELEIRLPPPTVISAAPPPAAVPPVRVKPTELLEVEFTPPVMEYPGRVLEVTIGATKSEGGTRGKTYTVGGETSPPFYLFERPPPHPVVISLDVFDSKIPLPKALKMHVKDVIGHPAEWARMAVEKFNADMITIHLMSIDPLRENAPPEQAAKTVEEVLQAVDVPIIVGGCGDPKKDLEVFEKVAEVTAGERVVMSTITLEMDLDRAGKMLKESNNIALCLTPIELNMARELNRKLYEYIPKENILMDLTTAALGYGIEYTFTIFERARLAALMGDPELPHPILCGGTNAWAAREAWMKESELGPQWGPRELRGPLWETITCITHLLAGADVIMMMHPAAYRTVKEVAKQLLKYRTAKAEDIENWVSTKI